jgi:3-polyprenyl-4-hydroxybenzoate decarboxylase
MMFMFTKYLVVVDDDVDVHNTSEVMFRLCAKHRPPSAIQFSPKGQPIFWAMQPLKSRLEQSWELTPRASSRVKATSVAG